MAFARIFGLAAVLIVQLHAREEANTAAEFLVRPMDTERETSLYYHPSNFGGGSTVSHQSYFDVIKQEFFKAVAGIGLVILAFPILYFNEKRQVHMEKIFAYGESIVKDNVSSDRVEESNNLCLVNVQGQTSTQEELRDRESGVSVTNCAKLNTVAEMYQWIEDQSQEERDTPTGGKETITTYSYRMDWSTSRQDSNGFNEPGGHENPPFELTSSSLVANDVNFGAYKLTNDLVGQMNKFTPLTKDGQLEMRGRTFVLSGDTYTTVEGGSPRVGDMKYTLTKVECGDATVLSIQKGNTFTPLTFDLIPHRSCCGSAPASGDKVAALEEPLLGKKTEEATGCCSLIGAAMAFKEELHDLAEEKLPASEMFARAKAAQNCIRQVMKIVGFMMFLFGFYFQFALFPALFRFIPFIGTWIQAFGNFFACLGALFMAIFHYCLTVAFAWMVLRPVKGVLMLCVAIAIIVVPTYVAGQSQ